jgi:hypothetical protein
MIVEMIRGGTLRSSIICILVMGSIVRAETEIGPRPPHPRLLFNAEGIARLRARAGTPPWNRTWQRFMQQVDTKLDQEIVLPPRGGNWSHNYVCPEHGARLSRGKQLGPWQWEHTCPVGPHTLKGDPTKATLDFDGNAIAGIHMGYSDEIRDMGIAFQVTGDARYGERAKRILLAYTQKYLTYDRHDNQGNPVTGIGNENGGSKSSGRVASQSLTEATWMIQVVQGADMVWNLLSDAQRKDLEEKMLRPALKEAIINHSNNPTIHNIQCRRNSAIGLIGFLLDDKQLIHEAIDGVHGYRAQMAKGVRSDGAWIEGAWGYHFFTIEGIWPLTEAARNCGINLYGPELGRMYEAPIAFATPKLTLPPFNDSGEVRLTDSPDRYELGYARYPNPITMLLLEKSRRDGQMALWFGVDKLGSVDSIPPPGSFNAPESGYAILRKGGGENATWACMKYGPHGGGHGHFDKLNVVLYARGQMIGVDSGTRAYGSPIHGGWDKTSIAHNTLTVDEKSQEQATGKSLAFGSDNGVDYAMCDAGPIYEGVRFIRTVATLNENVLLFFDQVQCDSPRTLDIAWHHKGKWGRLPEGKPWDAPKASGYTYFDHPSQRTTASGIVLPINVESDFKSLMVLAGGDETQVITGTGIGSSTADRVPMVLFRRKAKQTTFVWAISIDGSPLSLDHKENSVDVKSGEQSWHIQIDTEKPSVKASVS